MPQISAHHPDCHSHRQGKLGHLAHSLCTSLLSQCFNELALVTPPPELALPVDWLSLAKAIQASLKTSRCFRNGASWSSYAPAPRRL